MVQVENECWLPSIMIYIHGFWAKDMKVKREGVCERGREKSLATTAAEWAVILIFHE